MQEAMSVNAGTIDSLAEQIRAAKLAALGVTAEQAENLNLEAAARLKEAVGPERFAEIMHDGDYVKSPFSPDGMPEPDEVFPSDDAAIPIDPMEQPSGAGPVLEGSMADKAEHLRMQGDYIRQQREYLEEISRAGEDTHLSAEQAAAHSGDALDQAGAAVPEMDSETAHAYARAAAEGAQLGMGTGTLLEQGVLASTYTKVPAADVEQVMRAARSLLRQKLEADAAMGSGQIERARAIRRSMQAAAAVINRRYGGGVFEPVEQIPYPGQRL